MRAHEIYMRRCLELAENGLGCTAPNPLVGSVVVYEDQIIGEGWHKVYGSPHAEVNAIGSVQEKDLLRQSTIYVNLEPCAHWGKTPPCANLIIETGIPRVVVANRDPFPEVNGKGIKLLLQAGVEVIEGVLEKEASFINRRFFTFQQEKRPYIILKWAQSEDGFIAREDFSSKWISNPYSRLLVHKWRTEESAILVGTGTALHDNPQLTARDMSGKNPLRLVVDRYGKTPLGYHLMDGSVETWIFTESPGADKANLRFVKIDFDAKPPAISICEELYNHKIQSLIIEGGAQLINHFTGLDLWDEARVISSTQEFGKGIAAPALKSTAGERYDLAGNQLRIYYKK